MIKNLGLGFMLFWCMGCKKKEVPADTRLQHEEEVEITNHTDKSVVFIYVDTLSLKQKNHKSFQLQIPAKSMRKVALGTYYVEESKGFLDFCTLKSQAIMTFQDGLSKRDTSCLGAGVQNFKDTVNFFNTISTYKIGRSDYYKMFTYSYTITQEDYEEAR